MVYRFYHFWYWLTIFVHILPQVDCLSYVEKSVLDRLLTYYDDKVRPADKRNFFAVLDSDSSSPQPVVVNVTVKIGRMSFQDSMLIIDLELIEAWYDVRLQVLQNSEKVRQQFQIPDNAKIWIPRGSPVTNFHDTASSSCQQRKITLSDQARLESACRLLIQTHCDNHESNLPFTDSFQCRLQFEPEDTYDVNYFCDSCQQLSDASAPEHFTFQSQIRAVHSLKSDKDLLVDIVATTTTTTTSKLQKGKGVKRRRKRIQHKPGEKMKKNIKKSVQQNEYEYEDEGIFYGDEYAKMYIGDQIIIDITLTRSMATYNIITAIIPASLLVFLCWITLFSQRKMIRATFQSTTFFALIVLWGNHKQAPSATKLDMWLLICLCFICLCVLESLLLACVPWPRPRTPMEKRRESMQSINRVLVVNSVESKNHPNGGGSGILVQVEQCGQSVRRFVDKERVHIFFAFSYPIAFIGISLWFWLRAAN